jgi:hypothetical protein
MRRIAGSAELGRAHMGWDIALGLSALAPLFLCAGLAFLGPYVPALIPRTLSVMWSACLLAFFAGVRRGLGFSEAGGAGRGEIATLLGLFALAVAAMMFCSPALAAVGLVCVGALDAWAARRGETPAYFTAFRPIQMALAAAAMLVVQIRAG